MQYKKLSITEFFSQIDSEEKARNLIWQNKFDGLDFKCPHCGAETYYEYKCRPEIRKCRSCLKQVRARAGSIFEHSKIPLLTWVRAIFLMMSGKRGVSALEIYRQLNLKSYKTSWGMLQKIRFSLGKRDEKYKLENMIELDGTCFGKEATGNQREVLIAVESKDWIDDKGNNRSNAGFAKVLISKERSTNVESFLQNSVKANTEVHTDGAKAYVYSDPKFNIKTMNTYNDHILNEKWLPWVHRFISNAKTWVLGTHHGVSGHYLKNYLAEYTYRFNRRHDPKGLFSRTLFACSQSGPIRLGALSG